MQRDILLIFMWYACSQPSDKLVHGRAAHAIAVSPTEIPLVNPIAIKSGYLRSGMRWGLLCVVFKYPNNLFLHELLFFDVRSTSTSFEYAIECMHTFYFMYIL